MLHYLNGTVAMTEENLAVIDCGGIGFACHTTNYTLSRLQVGKPQLLYTYCNIREDAFDIYGFSTKEEVNCFRQLLGVSGVGPKAALAILSVLSPERFTLAVMTGDEKALSTASGVGKKMAQRVILELKDKLAGAAASFGGEMAASDFQPISGGKAAEASAALASLGYSQSEIGLAMRGIDVEALPLEEIVRRALRAMIAG